MQQHVLYSSQVKVHRPQEGTNGTCLFHLVPETCETLRPDGQGAPQAEQVLGHTIQSVAL